MVWVNFSVCERTKEIELVWSNYFSIECELNIQGLGNPLVKTPSMRGSWLKSIDASVFINLVANNSS